MLEDIEKFQEKLMAKYGVEAKVMIYFHLKENVELAPKLIEEFNLNQCEVSEHKSPIHYKAFVARETSVNNTEIAIFHNLDIPKEDPYFDEKVRKFYEKYEGYIIPESVLEDLVYEFLEYHWEKYGEEATYDQACDTTQAHQDLVKKVYDSWIKESVIA
jgi:hypothetical protein